MREQRMRELDALGPLTEEHPGRLFVFREDAQYFYDRMWRLGIDVSWTVSDWGGVIVYRRRKPYGANPYQEIPQ